MRTFKIKALFRSCVPGHECACAPTWLNTNTVCHRIDNGVTGFFRRIDRGLFGFKKVGDEFHGIIRNGKVYTTVIS